MGWRLRGQMSRRKTQWKIVLKKTILCFKDVAHAAERSSKTIERHLDLVTNLKLPLQEQC